ncbi:MAG: DUF1127 domain-containing protein [Pseudomonadota bacterium]
MAYVSTTQSKRSIFAARASSALQKLMSRYAKFQAYRETYNALSALSNRDLADLGISRSEVAYLAKKAAQEVG